VSDVATTTVEVVFRLPIWAEWVKALSLPIAAMIGIGIGAFNAWTAHLKRKQDLFDVRYEFYKRCLNAIPWYGKPYYFPDAESNYWSSEIGYEEFDKRINEFFSSTNELELLASESIFIFGEDIQIHLMALSNKIDKAKENLAEITSRFMRYEAPTFKDFDQPFRRYMRLR
jgi:hypothetical protein